MLIEINMSLLKFDLISSTESSFRWLYKIERSVTVFDIYTKIGKPISFFKMP